MSPALQYKDRVEAMTQEQLVEEIRRTNFAWCETYGRERTQHESDLRQVFVVCQARGLEDLYRSTVAQVRREFLARRASK